MSTNRTTMHVVIDGKTDNKGDTPFTAFWRGTGEQKNRAQVFRANLAEFKKAGPTVIHDNEESAKRAAWGE